MAQYEYSTISFKIKYACGKLKSIQLPKKIGTFSGFAPFKTTPLE